jgi:aminoglycoside phosphotransferase (APT) family kinase protein
MSAKHLEGPKLTRRPVHGFADDDRTRALLRSRPPAEALAWVGSATGGTVVSASAIRGGTSSAMHRVVVAMEDGAKRSVVLRRYVRPEVIAEEPDIAAKEARTLEFVAGLEIPTPLPVAVDPTGSEAGVPSVVMTRLAGRLEWNPIDVDRWLERLAELLQPIHSADPPATFPRFFPYAPVSFEPPSWAGAPKIWERAFEIFTGPAPRGEAVLVHRDFHPGNVLWRSGTVSGVVDWQAACIGPPAVDVGHCRTNLFQYGLDVADRFSAIWERISGGLYDPWSEIVSILGVSGVFAREPGPERSAMEVALSRAVSDVS